MRLEARSGKVNISLLLKIDFHVHTYFSDDGLITPWQLVKQLKRRGLNGVAITDHDTVEGIPKFSRILRKHGFLVVPGVEVSSSEGHVIALNVSERIPPGLGVNETVELIHETGGVAVAAHPTSLLKGCERSVSGIFDAIEVINASSFPFYFSVYFNRKLAGWFGLSQLAGSDAHYFLEVGSAYTLVKAYAKDVESVIKAIKKGDVRPCGGPVPLMVRIKREVFLFKKRFSTDYSLSI